MAIPMFVPDGKGGFKPNTNHPDHVSQRNKTPAPGPNSNAAAAVSTSVPMFIPGPGLGGVVPNPNHPAYQGSGSPVNSRPISSPGPTSPYEHYVNAPSN